MSGAEFIVVQQHVRQTACVSQQMPERDRSQRPPVKTVDKLSDWFIQGKSPG